MFNQIILFSFSESRDLLQRQADDLRRRATKKGKFVPDQPQSDSKAPQAISVESSQDTRESSDVTEPQHSTSKGDESECIFESPVLDLPNENDKKRKCQFPEPSDAKKLKTLLHSDESIGNANNSQKFIYEKINIQFGNVFVFL